jgi:transcriptional regulator with XRE-family HTH domain
MVASIGVMSAPHDATIGQMVRAARLEKGWSQEKLAEEVEMSQRWVSTLENDGVAIPRPNTLRALSAKLGLPLTDLYIAGRVARTKAEAQRLIEEHERIDVDKDDPLYNAVFWELRKLSPADLDTVRDIIRRLNRDRS